MATKSAAEPLRDESIVQLSEGRPAKPSKAEKIMRLRQQKQDDANALEEAYQAAEAERKHLHQQFNKDFF